MIPRCCESTMVRWEGARLEMELQVEGVMEAEVVTQVGPEEMEEHPVAVVAEVVKEVHVVVVALVVMKVASATMAVAMGAESQTQLCHYAQT
mmetsp:Transcript_47861/g.79209  ORF Transcript_47861/g.79209 Transcript_47861/m.79209 type:complete len:92 (+) Transcript_47861:149-424(+)